MKKRTPDFLALILAILIGFGNVYNVFLNFLRTPLKTQYLGISNFYVPDYLNYLAEVGQGMRGFWQAVNLYTQEGTVSYWVISWPYLLVGHLSRLFFLRPQVGYWISVFFLTGAIVFGAYLFLKVVLAAMGKGYLLFPILIVYLLATPFFLIRPDYPRVQIWRVTWYYQADFFERTSTILHHLVANLGIMALFLASFYFFELLNEKKYTFRSFLSWLGITFLLILVMSITPIKLTYLLPAFGITLFYSLFFYRFFNLKAILFYGTSFLGLLLTLFLFGLYFQKNVSAMSYPEIVAWEKSMMQWPSLKVFFITSGLVLVLAIPGLLVLIKEIFKTKIHPSIILGILASIFSYALFFTRFSLIFNNHNSRLLFPDAYLFMAAVIFLALDRLKMEYSKKKIIVLLVTMGIICVSLPSFYIALRDRSYSNPDFKEEYFKYLPEEIIEGFKFLGSQSPKNSLVLLSMVSGLRMILPIYAQARVYAARELVTINFPTKVKNCNDFFSNVMGNREKIKFLQKEKIDYIVFTLYDLGGLDKKYLDNPYFISKDLPVKLIFSNSMMVIYKVLRSG